MKPGFLSAGTASKPATQTAAPALEQPDDSVPAADAPPARRPAAGALPTWTAEQQEKHLEQCLALLRGPSDERRFVGLLLVTKALPAGDEGTVKRVFDAVGFTFLARLLLPLHAGGAAAEAVDFEELQKQAATATLGLAVLSSFARVPELAQAEEMVETLPLFMKVAREGGVGPILARASPEAAAAAAAVGLEPAGGSDAAAVEDALECALCVARASEEGRLVAEESGALSAARAVLQRGAGAEVVLGLGAGAVGGQVQEEGSAEQEARQQVRAWLLAVRLLATLLSGEDRGVVIADHLDEVEQLVPALARLLSLPASLPAPPKQPPAAAAGSSPRSDSSGGGGGVADLAILQLEVLHVLHLLLMHAAAEEGAALHAALASSAQQAQQAQHDWPRSIRTGLALVLRGRVSPVERHAALQLAAEMVELCGPQWLLGPSGGDVAAAREAGRKPGQQQGNASGGGSGAGSFYPVLVEVVKIETSVLLLDALAPSAPVPLAGEWAPAPPTASAARTAQGVEEGEGEEEGEETGSEGVMEIDAEGLAGEAGAAAAGPSAAGSGRSREGGSADVGLLHQVLRSDEERQKLERRLAGKGVPGAAVAAAAAAAASEAAPSAAIGAEAEAGPSGSGSGGGSGAGEGNREERVSMVQRVEEMQLPTGVGYSGPSEPAGARAARLLPACFALIEACIEALAVTTQEQEEGEAAMAGSGGPNEPPRPLLPQPLPPAVAMRALSSLQEVCEALLQLLEQTVGVPGRQGEGEGEAAEEAAQREALSAAAVRAVGRFCADVPEAFGPRLRQLLPRLLAAYPPAVGGGGEGFLPFLLPLLLQQVAFPAPGGDREEQAAWLGVLRSEEVLPHIARCVASAAAAYQACRQAPGELAPQADADLAGAGARLFNAATLLLATLSPRVSAAGNVPALVPQVLECGPLLLQQLLEALEGSPQPQLADLRVAGACAALCGALAAASLQQQQRQPSWLAEADQVRVSEALLRTLRQTAEGMEHLADGGGGGGDRESSEDLLEDLAQNLDSLAAAARAFLAASAAFAGACAADAWVQGLLAEGGLQALSLGEASVVDESGLQLFLGAVLDAQRSM